MLTQDRNKSMVDKCEACPWNDGKSIDRRVSRKDEIHFWKRDFSNVQFGLLFDLEKKAAADLTITTFFFW